MSKAALNNFIGGFNEEIDKKIDSQRTVNMYVLQSKQGKSQDVLVSFPGIKLKKTFIDETNIRSMYVTSKVFNFDEAMFVVVSDKVYQLDTAFNATLIGQLDTASGFVSISNNVNQVIFIDGSFGYIWDASVSTFQKITAPGFPVLPVNVAFLDGYFVVAWGNSSQFNVSALNDGLSWDPLAFVYMQSEPDKVVAIAQLHRRLFVFGTKITEVWYDAGEAGFPLKRDNNMLFQYGCLSKGSIAIGGIDEDKRMFWFAADDNGVGSILMSDGGSPKKISTPALEYKIQQYSNPQDCVGNAYKINGHTFYELSFNSDNHTWIFDLTTGMWFEGQMLDGSRKLLNCHAYFDKKHYIGSYKNSIIYEMSDEYTDNDGEPMYLERTTGHFSDPSFKRVHITRLYLDVVAGEGLPTPDSDEYNNIKVMCSPNKDNKGQFNYRESYIGRYGNRSNRCIFKRLGTARDWYFKFKIMTKSKVILLSAVIDYEAAGR